MHVEVTGSGYLSIFKRVTRRSLCRCRCQVLVFSAGMSTRPCTIMKNMISWFLLFLTTGFIIVSNIMRHLDTNNILTDCQHGFRPRRSCETQLITLVDELVKSHNKGKHHDLAILDFSKAFDRVPHERLLRKLDHHGIHGKTLDWIGVFLTDRTQKVAVEGVVSEPIHVKSGVPQGSVLGPILFLVFINDLPASIRSSSRLFVDDCVVYREIRSGNDCQILQDDLQKLWDWEKKWGVSFHPEKYSLLRVHR